MTWCKYPDLAPHAKQADDGYVELDTEVAVLYFCPHAVIKNVIGATDPIVVQCPSGYNHSNCPTVKRIETAQTTSAHNTNFRSDLPTHPGQAAAFDEHNTFLIKATRTKR